MGFDEIEGKMIGLVGVSGEAMGAANVLSSLLSISATNSYHTENLFLAFCDTLNYL